MLMYAVAVIPLIRLFSNLQQWYQVWYTHDASCLAKLDRVKEWFLMLHNIGPKFAYHPEPKKCFLIVKDEFLPDATSLFEDLGVNVVNSGRL